MNVLKMVSMLALLLGIHMSGWGQVTILKDAGVPTEMEVGDWYLDTLGHIAWYQYLDTWKSLEGTFSDIIACGLHALLYDGDLYYIYVPILEKYENSGRHYLCQDTTLWLWGDDYFMAYGRYNVLELPVITFRPFDMKSRPSPELVQGIPALCFVEYTPDFFQFVFIEWRNWGMYGINGQWLIPPVYDEPFHFENGIAEVLYYGQKLKINEKGEFLDGD